MDKEELLRHTEAMLDARSLASRELLDVLAEQEARPVHTAESIDGLYALIGLLNQQQHAATELLVEIVKYLARLPDPSAD